MARLIIIALCIYLLYIWVLRPLLRVLLQKMVKKAVESQFGSPNNTHNQRPRQPEGSIHVDYIPGKDKKGPPRNDEGEYIDYEEVK